MIISKSVIKIGDYAFYKCSTLRNVSFEEPSSLKEIGKFAFYGCSALTDFKVPASVETIGESALPPVEKKGGFCNIF